MYYLQSRHYDANIGTIFALLVYVVCKILKISGRNKTLILAVFGLIAGIVISNTLIIMIHSHILN